MIKVIDNFLTDQQATELHRHATTAQYSRNHNSDGFASRDSLRFVHHFDPKLFEKTDIMDTCRDNFGEISLVSAYINASDYATTTLAHIDSTDSRDMTIIVYLNQNWHVNYQGSTLFMKGFALDEIIKAVHPKPKRAVAFDSNIWHLACSPTPDAGVRYTLAIKVKRETQIK